MPGDDPHGEFCYEKIKKRVVAESNSVVAIKDKYPVTEAHHLILPKRHVFDYFEMTQDERIDAEDLIRVLKKRIEENDKTITGFNIAPVFPYENPNSQAECQGPTAIKFRMLLLVKDSFSGIDQAFLPIPHFIAVFIILNSASGIDIALLQVTLIFPACAFNNLSARGNIALLCIKGIGCAGCFASDQKQNKHTN